MSETCDVNVLVYATDPGSPFHEAAREFVHDLMIGPRVVYLFWPVVMGYMRIVTNPSILGTPIDYATAAANVEELIARRHVRMVTEGRRFWRSYRAAADQVRPRGKLVPDAHLVALMREHGVDTIWTRDRDFRKFDGIRVKDPFAE